MAIINAKVDDKLVKEFRHVIYERHGLKKGDFKNALEEAMLDYIQKYSTRGASINRLAATAKTISPSKRQQDNLASLYSELRKLGADVDEIKRLSPTLSQVKGLLEGLKRLQTA